VLFTARFQKLSFSFANSTAYNIYRLSITQLRGPAPTAVQLAEIEFIGTTPAPPAKATIPNPANSATGVSATPTLSWTAGTGAASHDVYFGTSLSDVNNASRLLADLNGNGIVDWLDVSRLTDYWLLDPAGSEPYAGVNDDNTVDFFDYALLAQDWKNSANPVFKGNRGTNSFNPGTLALNTTYYWRIDEVNGPDTVKGDVWSFTTQSNKAINPTPANGAAGVGITTDLSWTAGAGAISHDVYFGTTNPPPSRGNQAGTTFDTGTMTNSTTYYWRIDEVGGSGTVTGDVWNFMTAASVPANRKKGPYLIYPGVNTQMTVLWQIDVTTTCNIVWGTDTTYSLGSVNTTEYSTGTDGHQHKYNITGLTPGTKYYYRVTIGSNNYTGSFYAAPAASATDLKFFMYGDTRTNGSWHNSVAGRMVSAYTADPAYQTMVLHAGDWVESDTEAFWTSQWYNYTYTNIVNTAASMPIMGTIGNHEGNGSCPIFEKYRPFPFAAAPADYFSFDYGPVHVAVVDQYTTYTNPSTQYTWLHNDLTNSTKPWKIIVLHAPGWSCNGGHPNDTTVQGTIQPLCVDHGVQIVLAGHNHYYSRAVNNGVHHVTSGSGGAPYYSAAAGQPYVVTYSTDVLECVKVEINGNTLTGNTVSDGGIVIDTFTITRP
jgi:predicted phosphodiesterase